MPYVGSHPVAPCFSYLTSTGRVSIFQPNRPFKNLFWGGGIFWGVNHAPVSDVRSGAAVCVAVASQYPGISPALADPSYTSDKVIDVFVKNKAAVDAYKAETKTRRDLYRHGRPVPDAKSASARDFRPSGEFRFQFRQADPDSEGKPRPVRQGSSGPSPQRREFEIDGHTDATGTEVYNQGLSERRADAVVSYLTSQGTRRVGADSRGLRKDEATRRRSFQPREPPGRDPFDGVKGFIPGSFRHCPVISVEPPAHTRSGL